MQIFKKEKVKKDLLLLDCTPISLEFKQGEPAILIDKLGKKHNFGCLNCINKNCCFFKENEIKTDNLIDFPFDMNMNVCPVDALKIDEFDQSIIIDNTKCIKCGLCALRCPVGAIYFDSNGLLNVNQNKDELISKPCNADSIEEQNCIQNFLLSIERKGQILKESDKIFDEIYFKINKLDSKYYDLIGRNLLIGLLHSAGKRRTGDVYTRMDGVYQTCSKIFGAVEVEFGSDTLDASRAILDDIATLNVRYHIDKMNNRPLIICLSLPNARQGYWQVIKDIAIIESIKIKTLSIGAILLLLWNCISINLEADEFYIDFDNKTLRKTIEILLNRKINVSEKHLGIFEPLK